MFTIRRDSTTFSATQTSGPFFMRQEGTSVAALPFLVQSVADVPGLAAFDVNDAVSVYGYAGPVTNLSINDQRAMGVRQRFQAGCKLL